MKVIVAGSREFNNEKFIFKKLDELLKQYQDIEIVEGACRGVDLIARKYAINNDLSLKEFPAQWNTYGKAAGGIRNDQMAKYADVLIAFYDGSSKGTSNMIKAAKRENLDVHIVNIKDVK